MEENEEKQEQEKLHFNCYTRIIAERYASRIVMDVDREFNKELNEKTLIEYLVHAIENS